MREFLMHSSRALLLCALLSVSFLASKVHADSYTVLLLHGDGGNGSTQLLDYGKNHTMTANGNAQISTAQSVFGGGSMLFDGTGDYYSTPDSSDWDLGSGNFTIDFWVWFNTVGNETFLSQLDVDAGTVDNSFLFRMSDANTANFYYTTNGSHSTAVSHTFSWSPSTSAWYHVALVRGGSSLYFFVNGIQVGTTKTISETIFNSTKNLQIGSTVVSTGQGQYLNGYIDELRISKGVARWTANFTPPREPYNASVILTKNSSLSKELDITGALAKGSGTFVIDDPIDPANKLLFHSFVESPDVKNIYDGIVTLDKHGTAEVALPSYFLALNQDFRYLATPLGEPMPNLFLKSEVRKSFLGFFGTPVFYIGGGTPGGRVSWQVTGIRHDPYILAHPIVPEVEKSDATVVNKGEYLFEGYPLK